MSNCHSIDREKLGEQIADFVRIWAGTEGKTDRYRGDGFRVTYRRLVRTRAGGCRSESEPDNASSPTVYSRLTHMPPLVRREANQLRLFILAFGMWESGARIQSKSHASRICV